MPLFILDPHFTDPERIGVIIGTGIGGMRAMEVQTDNLVRRGPGRVSPTLVPSAVPDVAGNEVALAEEMCRRVGSLEVGQKFEWLQ